MTTHTIEQQITGWSVGGAPASDPPAPADPPAIEQLTPRPPVLSGSTYKLKTPLSDHALYITINDHDGKPFEIFINSKNMDHFQWTVALTRIISAVFRKGGEVSFLVEELRSVYDPRGGYLRKGGYVPSLVAEIGGVIEQHLQSVGLIGRPDTGPSTMECPSCGQMSARMMDGCLTCLDCGYSKCG